MEKSRYEYVEFEGVFYTLKFRDSTSRHAFGSTFAEEKYSEYVGCFPHCDTDTEDKLLEVFYGE